jgi:predicted nucleic acid-binding protein
MGAETKTMKQAWKIYDFWVEDPRIDLHPEPRGVEAGFRETTEPFALNAASKWVGDCYLLAYAEACGATLVTYDKALLELAGTHGYAAILPA